MKCQNCGKNEANVKYTQIINGIEKKMELCENCAKKLGITEQVDFNFNMPIGVESFLGEFLNDYDNGFLPAFNNTKVLKCKNCGMDYSEFIDTGKFGCSNCYNVFSEKLDKIFKNIHGSNRYIGRKGKEVIGEKFKTLDKKEDIKNKEEKLETKEDKLIKLKEELAKSIKEERYEDSAKLRDEIKKIEEKNNKK